LGTLMNNTIISHLIKVNLFNTDHSNHFLFYEIETGKNRVGSKQERWRASEREMIKRVGGKVHVRFGNSVS
jgi:hypothetical protein